MRNTGRDAEFSQCMRAGMRHILWRLYGFEIRTTHFRQLFSDFIPAKLYDE